MFDLLFGLAKSISPNPFCDPILWSYKVKISGDALRMRCRRLCEKKASGRYNIDEKTAAQYKEGGPSREILEMALLECLAKHGLDRSSYKKVKVTWIKLESDVFIYIVIFKLQISWIYKRHHDLYIYIYIYLSI